MRQFVARKIDAIPILLSMGKLRPCTEYTREENLYFADTRNKIMNIYEVDKAFARQTNGMRLIILKTAFSHFRHYNIVLVTISKSPFSTRPLYIYAILIVRSTSSYSRT